MRKTLSVVLLLLAALSAAKAETFSEYQQALPSAQSPGPADSLWLYQNGAAKQFPLSSLSQYLGSQVSGTPVLGHVLQFGPSAGFIADGGGAAGGAVGANPQELGVTSFSQNSVYPSVDSGNGPNKEHECYYDGPKTGAGGHSLCFDPNAGGGALVSYQAWGNAGPLPLMIKVNGAPWGGGTTPAAINVAAAPYNVSTTASGATNYAGLNAAAAAACAAATTYGGAKIVLPPGQFSVALDPAPAMLINCSSVTVEGAGDQATIFQLSGTGDFLVFQPPAGTFNILDDVASGFRTYRQDSPVSGRGLWLDHAYNTRVENVHLTGSYTDFECNMCVSAQVDGGSIFDGIETQAGSALAWVHHTVSTLTTTGHNSGATIPVSSTIGVYVGQTYVSGDSNIQAGSTILSYVKNVSITLSVTPTGTTGIGDTLVFKDTNAGITFADGDQINTGAPNAPWTYDYALLVQDVDGLTLGGIHVAWARKSSLFVQPQYAVDSIDNIISSPNTYFDTSGAYCAEFEPYGGFTTTITGDLSTGSENMSIASTPPADITGYAVLINGVTAGTTVASGGATESLTLSADPITNTASGATVTFYPTSGVSGNDGADNLYGICQGQNIGGVLLNDPRLTNIRGELNILNMPYQGFVIHAGTQINFSGSNMQNINSGNNAAAGSLVDGNANGVMIGGMFAAGNHGVPYWLDVEGQAANILLTPSVLNGSTVSDVRNGSSANGNGLLADTFVTDNAFPNVSRFLGIMGNTAAFVGGYHGGFTFQFATSVAAPTGYYPVSQVDGGGWQLYGNANSEGGTVNAGRSSAGALNVGVAHADQVNLSAPPGAPKISGAFSAAGIPLPSCTSGLAGYLAWVTDITTYTFNAPYVSGGSNVGFEGCDGSAWKAH